MYSPKIFEISIGSFLSFFSRFSMYCSSLLIVFSDDGNFQNNFISFVMFMILGHQAFRHIEPNRCLCQWDSGQGTKN